SQAAARNALARRIGTSQCRRSMLAFQFVSLLPTYHLVNGQTSDQANWAHGRRREASSSRVLKNPSGLGGTGVQAVTRDSRTARKLFKNALSHPPTPHAPRRTPFPSQGGSKRRGESYCFYTSSLGAKRERSWRVFSTAC